MTSTRKAFIIDIKTKLFRRIFVSLQIFVSGMSNSFFVAYKLLESKIELSTPTLEGTPTCLKSRFVPSTHK